MPFYKGEWIKFDVMPTEMKFTVNHESLALKVNIDLQINTKDIKDIIL